MSLVLTNNAATTLASAITAIQTTLPLAAGTGTNFPAPSAGQWSTVTIANAAGVVEICKVTGRSGDTLTVLRGQEGTVGYAFSLGDKVECRLTAAGVANKLDVDSGGTVSGPVTVNGALTAQSATISGNAAVAGSASVAGNFSSGATTVASLTSTGAVSAASSSVSGNSTVGGTHTVTGNESVGGTLTVTGTATFNGALSAPGGITGVVTGTANPTNFTGMVAPFAMSTAPTGWLAANGAAVSRTTYAALFTAIGITYGSGDGSTTFNVPDLRGYFVRGWDNGAGNDPGRAFGTTQTDAMQGHVHSLPSVPQDGTGYGYTGTSGVTSSAATATGSPVTDGSNGTPRTAAETRPKNVALLYCIKT